MSPQPKIPKQRVDHVLSRQLDDELIILDQGREEIHQLNATAVAVWQLCNGTRSDEDIVLAMNQAYDVPLETLRRDVAMVLEELERLGLIEFRQ